MLKHTPAAGSKSNFSSALTFKEFTQLARRRSWTVQSLSERFRGRLDNPAELFTRVLGGKSPANLIPYRSVIELYTAALTPAAAAADRPTCACGCGLETFDRKKWATSGCRTKAQRGKVRNQQFCPGQLVDFVDPKLRQNGRKASPLLTERIEELQG